MMAKRKVLILAYDFPPYNSIASQRPLSWCKYFKNFGLEPTIVTLHWDNNIANDQSYIIPSFKNDVTTVVLKTHTEIRVPFHKNLRDKILYKHGFGKYTFLRKILTLYYYLLRFVSFRFDNTRSIYKEASKLIKKEPFDFIIATGEPFILFKYAYRLSKNSGVPWVADYRDPWTTNKNTQTGLLGLVDKLLYSKLEYKYVRTAKFISTAAPSYKNSIEALFPAKRIEVVFNGSDIENLDELRKIEQDSASFQVAYAGRLYAHQDLEIFLEGYKLFLTHFNFKVKSNLIFFGLKFYQDNVKRLLEYDASLREYISITDRLPYQDMIRGLKKANILLLLSSKGADWLNAKIFDYLPLNRKIFLVSDDKGILRSLIDQHEAGEAFDNAEDLSKRLIQLYSEFLQTGFVSNQTKDASHFSREHQALHFSKCLLSCLE